MTPAPACASLGGAKRNGVVRGVRTAMFSATERLGKERQGLGKNALQPETHARRAGDKWGNAVALMN